MSSKAAVSTCLSMFIFFSYCFAQDMIIHVNGKTGTGRFITFAENNQIVFRLVNEGAPSIFPIDSVSTIILEDGTKYEFGDVSSGKRSGYNPCEDEKYVLIKNKSFDEMSEREYQYFLQKDRECAEFMKGVSSGEIQVERDVSTASIQSQPVSRMSSANYYHLGQRFAENSYAGGGAFLGGALSGFFGSFLGWGIGYAVVSGMNVEVPASQLVGLNSDQRLQFEDGYRSKVKAKRKTQFNTGGGLGTLVWLIVWASRS